MRYLLLLILNLPIIILAFLNVTTDFKMKKITRNKFLKQIIVWVFILVVIIGSFPVYNLLSGKDILNSSELSLFDIAEITVITWIIYSINSIRQKLDKVDLRQRKIHEELSIKLSETKK